MRTRTVNILNSGSEVADYIEYLTSNAWPIIRIRKVECGRFSEITFAY